MLISSKEVRGGTGPQDPARTPHRRDLGFGAGRQVDPLHLALQRAPIVQGAGRFDQLSQALAAFARSSPCRLGPVISMLSTSKARASFPRQDRDQPLLHQQHDTILLPSEY